MAGASQTVADQTMKALVYDKYETPEEFTLIDLPKPVIKKPSDVIIKVHAASINPIDVQIAAGYFQTMVPETFPAIFGYDVAGVVEAVGSDVSTLAVGDAVYGRLGEADRGAFQEYARSDAENIVRKPESLSFEEAASLPLAGLAALQSLQLANGGLEGKTVLVTGGLTGTGSAACQIAKNVLKAAKVITTVSTAKVARVPELLGAGVVDQIIDYTKEDPTKILEKKSVDFVFDTIGDPMSFLHLIRPGGNVVSLAATYTPADLRGEYPATPLSDLLRIGATDMWFRLRASRHRVTYKGLLMRLKRERLLEFAKYVEEGKIKPVVGKVVAFSELEALRLAFDEVLNAKGITGKTVLKMIV